MDHPTTTTPVASGEVDAAVLPYSPPATTTAPPREASTLRDLTPAQWKSGIAAWLGWLFDGLDMHLYTMVAASFVAILLTADPASPVNSSDAIVKQKSSWIQAAFLIGWALGGGFFGRLGDRMGRARALSLTVLTYALFTGLSAFATQWWHLLIFRFLAALGIGGEWAVGSSLLSETWPRNWRPWIAAVLQTAVNLGVLIAFVAASLMKGINPRFVFLVGILPAFIVFWIRRHVPEPEEWHTANAAARAGSERQPSIADLFRGPTRRITLLTIVVCACALTSWWSIMFWVPQLMNSHPDIRDWSDPDKRQMQAAALMLPVLVSIPGNFFAAWLAKIFGFRRAIAVMCLGFVAAITVAFCIERSWMPLLYFYIPLVGFFSGIFGLFTMYLPPLFPTLLRTTGAGFCYNIGRIASAVGVILFGIFANSLSGQLRIPLLVGGFLFIPAMFAAMLLPDHTREMREEAPRGPIE